MQDVCVASFGCLDIPGALMLILVWVGIWSRCRLHPLSLLWSIYPGTKTFCHPREILPWTQAFQHPALQVVILTNLRDWIVLALSR